MKFLKYSFTALLALAFATSCSDSGYYDEYNANEAQYSFEQSEFNTLWASGQEPESFTLSVIRNTTVGDASVGLKLTTDYTDRIQIPATVEFTDGQNVATFVVNIDGLQVGEETVGVISLVDVNISPSGNDECTLSLNLDYNWVLLEGEGGFIDQFFMDDVYPVQIYNAEGFPLYRVMAPYDEWSKSEQAIADWEGWLAGPYPEYIEFWETQLSDGTPVLNWSAYSSGLIYQGVEGQYIGVYPPYALGYSMDNCQWLAEGIAGFSPYYYITGVGGWNYTSTVGVILIALPGHVDEL